MLNKRLNFRLDRVDWDFTGAYSESLFSAIHWYPGRFPSQLPATLIGLLSEPGEVVLDPYSGAGTTLVEAQRLGRPSVGIDVNPIGCLVSAAKTLSVKAPTVTRYVGELTADAQRALSPQMSLNGSAATGVVVPASVQQEKWYSRNTRVALGRLWALVRTYSGSMRLLSEAAFSAILLSVCRETRHWGYVCDNTTPVGNRDGDVLKEYCAILERFRVAYSNRDEYSRAQSGVGFSIKSADVRCGDARKELQALDDQSVALVVTSPPYFGVCDYVKAQRLSMEWNGYELEACRRAETGARSKRHRKNARDDYIAELRGAFAQVWRVLRHRGHCVAVLGESKKRSPVLSSVRQALVDVGFSEDIDIKRRVSLQRRQNPSVNHERVMVFTREE